MTQRTKFLIVVLVIAFTLTFHYYDLLFAQLIGHSHLMHAIHGRLCYIPIVLAAFWFGIRGGILSALIISAFSIVYIFIHPLADPHDAFNEYTEIAFYLAIGSLAGVLLENERSNRRKREDAERKLGQAERLSLVGQMVASIAHEIKNPLGSIKGAVQILKDPKTPSTDKIEFTDIIEKEVDRLDGVVGEYLSYAKPAPSKVSNTNMGELAATVIKQIKYQCDERGIKIILEQNKVPPITADANKLRQVLLNILLNAIQAMPNGGEIRFSCRQFNDDSGNRLELRIADTGPGISPENLAKIFDPFFSTKAHGTGLGLATAQAIVSEHNGLIVAESKLGEGTTFIISLPINH
jgi:two-component system sensor histidine kinase HydH